MIIRAGEASIDEVRRISREREEMRNRFSSTFVRYVFQTVEPGTVFDDNWHIGLIAEYCHAMYLGQVMKLVINVPPRTTKSLTVSVGFPCWILGQDPSYRILAGSGVQKLATRFNDWSRKVLLSGWYRATFPKTVMRKGQNEKTFFETTENGYRLSASFGSSVVGEGGRQKIIDDPIDPEKAFSAAEIEQKTRYYDNSWSTRSDNPEEEREVLLMQRVHRLDLSAHLLETGEYEHVCIEQEAKKRKVITFPLSGKIITREEGEFINPRRFGEKAKSSAVKKLGSAGYKAQHQQDPVAMGGNKIQLNWFPRYQTPVLPGGNYLKIVFSADTASKKRDLNAPTAIHVFVQKQDKLWYLAEVVREKMLYPELKHKLITLESKWRPHIILVEDKSSGTQLIQEGRDIEINQMIAIEPDIDKIGRMEREMGPLENGLIVLPDPQHVPTSWLYDFEDELTDFPMAVTMDQIDSLSQFLRWIRETKGDSKVETW